MSTYNFQLLIRLLTDPQGTVTDRYSYRAFGELLEHVGDDPNPYLFAGEPFEEPAGLYYNRARWLDVSLGRFVSPDPARGNLRDPRSFHPYTYAHLDPVSLVDPSGKFSVGAAGALVTLSVMGLLAVTVPLGGQELARGESRPMTSGEISFVDEIFLGSINYGKVRIFNKKWAPFHGKNIIMAPNGNVYLE